MPADDIESVPTRTNSAGSFATREQFYAARELEPIQVIGQGGFAEVWLARRRHLDLQLAIKFFSPHPLVVNSEIKMMKARQRLLREGKLLGAVRHSNIVRIVDLSIIVDDPVLVLEYIVGDSVDNIVRKKGLFTPVDTVTCLLGILSALNECHSIGIFHRDIAPRNVIVEPNGRAVLIDFGLGYSSELTDEARLTSQPMGTAGYSPPELSSEPLLANPAVDIFGVGAVGVYMLTGRPPKLGIPLIVPNAPPSLVGVLQRAVDADPQRRFPSAEAMENVLATILDRPSTQKPATLPIASTLTDKQCFEVLDISPRAVLDERSRMVISQFAASTTRILSGDRLHDLGLALLLSAARSALDRTCEAGELVAALGNLLSAILDAVELPPRERLRAAFGQAEGSGFLKIEEHDTWHPGMESGTGMRDFYVVTGVGYRWLRQNAGFDPPPDT